MLNNYELAWLIVWVEMRAGQFWKVLCGLKLNCSTLALFKGRNRTISGHFGDMTTDETEVESDLY